MNMYLELQAEKGVKSPTHYNFVAPHEEQGKTRRAKGGYSPRFERAKHHIT